MIVRPGREPHGRAALEGQMISRTHSLNWCLVLAWLVCTGLVGAGSPALGRPVAAADLGDRRARQRQLVRDASAAFDKTVGPARFGLLVIPVDFSDTRLNGDWSAGADLVPRLTPADGLTLRNYFHSASLGKTDLSIVTAPLVHLTGRRQDYSDVGWNGFTRSRALATEALEATRDRGIDFRLADLLGDDGEVDGVLILHAGPGLENDSSGGWIQPLQFFLDEPVESRGTRASLYAVASMHSALGVWAHETGHLVGLEDRYDPLLFAVDSGSELQSRGGLGRYSLMSSGAWGAGAEGSALDAQRPALPDAYSCLQLGWYTSRSLPLADHGEVELLPTAISGEVGRIWTRGESGPEFFLLEVRDPVASAPYDTGLPERNLIIYHVDETVAEGAWHDDGFDQYHLRVRLVEADADGGLAGGGDRGRDSDLFPGTLGVTEFGPLTDPHSDGYPGPSLVHLTDIRTTADGVAFAARAHSGSSLEFASVFQPVQEDLVLGLTAVATGDAFAALSCQITAWNDPTWGDFGGGETSVVVDLVEVQSGRWEPATPIPWYPAAEVPSGAQTRFSYRFTTAGWESGHIFRTWAWNQDPDILDFAAVWPGQWSIDHPTGEMGTTWQRWTDAEAITSGGSPVLACTGAAYSGADWPSVQYQNDALTTLTSGPLGPELTGVRMIHAVDTEVLTGDTFMDGGGVVWVGPDGYEVAAEPVGGWRGIIEPRSNNALHGTHVFPGGELELEQGYPLWRSDVIPLPTGAGPWRLRLQFASNSAYRYRGWFIAAIEQVWSEPSAATFTAVWQGTATADSVSGLYWTWPVDWAETPAFRVESASCAEEWQLVTDESHDYPGNVGGGFRLDAGMVLDSLTGPLSCRNLVRVRGYHLVGTLQVDAQVVYRDGGGAPDDVLGLPWPNPAPTTVQFLLDVPEGPDVQLRIYNLAGRLIQEMTYPTGTHVAVWDGTDGRGRRVAAGLYLVRLEGSGFAHTRKVVLLH